jgi:hypothetical protein
VRQQDDKARSFFDQPIPNSLHQAVSRRWMISGDGLSTNRPKPRQAAPLRSGLGYAGCEVKDWREDGKDVRRRHGHLDDRDRSLPHSTFTLNKHRKAALRISFPDNHLTLINAPTFSSRRPVKAEFSCRRNLHRLFGQGFDRWRGKGCSHQDFTANRLRTHVAREQQPFASSSAMPLVLPWRENSLEARNR